MTIKVVVSEASRCFSALRKMGSVSKIGCNFCNTFLELLALKRHFNHILIAWVKMVVCTEATSLKLCLYPKTMDLRLCDPYPIMV